MIINDNNIEVHADSDVTQRGFKRAVATGRVHFYRVRRNGTTRHIPYLAPDTEARKIAEQIEGLRDKDVSVATIAKQVGMSEPTVRRYIERLRFSREVEKVRGQQVATLLQKAKHEG